MVDYGEFVPYALLESDDFFLKTLGEKMDLIPLTTEDLGETSYNILLERLLEGTTAVIDSYSYIRYVFFLKFIFTNKYI